MKKFLSIFFLIVETFDKKKSLLWLISQVPYKKIVLCSILKCLFRRKSSFILVLLTWLFHRLLFPCFFFVECEKKRDFTIIIMRKKKSSLVLCFIIVKCSLRCNKFFVLFLLRNCGVMWWTLITHKSFHCDVFCYCQWLGQGQTIHLRTEAPSDDLFRVHLILHAARKVFRLPNKFPSHICFLHRSGRIIYPSLYLHTWKCWLWSCVHRDEAKMLTGKSIFRKICYRKAIKGLIYGQCGAGMINESVIIFIAHLHASFYHSSLCASLSD